MPGWVGSLQAWPIPAAVTMTVRNGAHTVTPMTPGLRAWPLLGPQPRPDTAPPSLGLPSFRALCKVGPEHRHLPTPCSGRQCCHGNQEMLR